MTSRNLSLPYSRLVLLSAACGMMAGCGGESDTSPAVTASPTSVLAATTPAAVPQADPPALAFATLQVGVSQDSSGELQVHDPAEASVPVIVRDPDAVAGSTFNDLLLNGNEHITTYGFGPRQAAMIETKPVSSWSKATYTFSQAALFPRTMPALGFAAAGSDPLSLPLTETFEKIAGMSVTSGERPDHLAVMEVGAPAARAIRIFGSNTKIANLPTSGSKRFVGEIFGTVYPTGESASRVVGDCILNAFFDNGEPRVAGLIRLSQYERSDNRGVPLTIEFQADIVNGKLVTCSINVTGTGYAVMAGSVAGGFYGDDVSELGFVISARGPSGVLIGGAALGQRH